MLTTVLDTACLPPADARAAWTETAALALVTTRFTFPERHQYFGARIRAMELGAIQLSVMTYSPLLSYRSPLLIRQSDPELYQIALITSGQQIIEQARNCAALRADEMVLYDSSRPFEASVRAGEEGASSLLLQFPRELMPLSDKVVAPLCGTVLRGAAGMGYVFRQTLGALAEAEAELTDGDRARLSTTVLDLAAALIAGQVDRMSALPRRSRMKALFHEILAFIIRNLRDPGLGPTLIAEAHCISTRSLYRIFQAYGNTVGEVIRRERISRCRRDLADPLLYVKPVSAIGAQWGFPRPSEFTRAFHAATGMTPTAYRAAACRP
ncbi:helix-turn-helix domain-containing protein [Streptomyces sp. NPDC092903]|uniref:AraC-like ligand-binding domain-containing protein n=1 Tax=Streptomyces sp. NPDC092903 TaxID=3366017 RepID=UPI0038038632